MRSFVRRFRPDHLAGQVAILILASIVLFHIVATVAFSILGTDRRSPYAGPVELAAGYLMALDLAPVAERQKVLEELAIAAPGTKITISEQRPAAGAGASMAQAEALRSRLWKGAEAFPVAVAGPVGDRSEAVAVALRRGGYAVAIQQWRFDRFEAPPPTAPGSPPPGLPQPGLPPPGFPHPAPSLTGIWIGSALFFFLCAAILTIWTSNAVVSPLVELARRAETFPHESGERELIAEEGPQEVRDLTRALNRMQDRIFTMIAARARILAAISHDLRTIITRLRLRAEFIGDESLRNKMLHDVDLMDSMLHKNLLYLRDERYRQPHGLVDLDSVLQTVSDQFSDLGRDVSYESAGRHMVAGSLTDLQRVFNNLVENATVHADRVVISVAQPSVDVIHVDVADDGPGIPAEDKELVVEPFVRGRPARNLNEHGGFGLGLSIVRSLVEEIGGTLQLLDREPHGLIARVVLPLAVPGCEASKPVAPGL